MIEFIYINTFQAGEELSRVILRKCHALTSVLTLLTQMFLQTHLFHLLCFIYMCWIKHFLVWTLAQCALSKQRQKNPLRSSCITSYQGTGNSGTTASGVSRHVSFELYNGEEGTPPLWSGCLSPPSLIPTPSSQNPESKRKQSVEAAALTGRETDAKTVPHLPYDSQLQH